MLILPFILVFGFYTLLKKNNPDTFLKGLGQGKKNYQI